MNVELLQEVKEKILAEPQSFDMCSWHRRSKCGTTHCIAGWADVLVNQEEFPSTKSEAYYASLFGLGLQYEKTSRLFYVEQWPEPFRTQYLEKDLLRSITQEDLKDLAQIAANRIDLFIETNGAV